MQIEIEGVEYSASYQDESLADIPNDDVFFLGAFANPHIPKARYILYQYKRPSNPFEYQHDPFCYEQLFEADSITVDHKTYDLSAEVVYELWLRWKGLYDAMPSFMKPSEYVALVTN